MMMVVMMIVMMFVVHEDDMPHKFFYNKLSGAVVQNVECGSRYSIRNTNTMVHVYALFHNVKEKIPFFWGRSLSIFHLLVLRQEFHITS